MTSKTRSTGFTLFELLIVIAIAGILAAIGTSSFKYFTAANRIATETNALLGDMQFARSEAQKEGLFVTICPTNGTGTACTASSNWSNGWIVFVDFSNNQTYSQPHRRRYAPALAESAHRSTDVGHSSGHLRDFQSRRLRKHRRLPGQFVGCADFEYQSRQCQLEALRRGFRRRRHQVP